MILSHGYQAEIGIISNDVDLNEAFEEGGWTWTFSYAHDIFDGNPDTGNGYRTDLAVKRLINRMKKLPASDLMKAAQGHKWSIDDGKLLVLAIFPAYYITDDEDEDDPGHEALYLKAIDSAGNVVFERTTSDVTADW